MPALALASPPPHVRDAVVTLQAIDGAPGGPLTDREAEAVAVLYRSYGAMLLAVARRLLGGAAEAEDALHDMFCRLPWTVAQYRGGGLGGWLKQTLVRTALMRLRSARRRREAPLPPPDARDALDALRGAPTDADFRALGRDDDVRRALAALSGPLREVVVLRVFLDFTHREIAEALDITATASEVRLCRALKQLRLLLGAGGEESVARRRAS